MREPSVENLDERALVQRFLHRRDEQAFRALYRAHAAAMLAVASRFVGGESADTEDVVQEAWIHAATRLPSFRWESALRTWLVGIVVNCARNRLRRRITASREVDLASVAELPAPPHLTPQVVRIDLERAIAQLPNGYRDVLILHDVFGYTHDEIGVMLGVETGTSKSQLARARMSLRRRLDEKGTGRHERRSR